MILKGHRALVTGGTRGIGRAIAIALKQAGADVLITGTQENTKVPPGYQYEAVDFSDEKFSKLFFGKIKKSDFTILINNAGINKIAPFSEISSKDYENIQRINMRAPFLLSQAVLPAMRKKKWGRIINMASVFGVVSREFRASYSVSKFGLDGMTAALAAEVAKEGILVNTVSPGFIDTELTRSVLGEEGMREMAARIPMKRLGKPEEIAKLVCWLVSPENTYISGQNIIIDGGFTRV
ncbi:MAG: dehydrogenase [Gammaproteobacteria bacterium RIFCSPLOWO2_02_FULL_38_11]|nr:MAG: dehydrogenase [Gammaproteobacteria bacterium RIFCSPHIGHO2_02_FULL_38_33]OGT24148.1 MAG: dehydrogenase [Gammaproteobacteria bacterium RIFCSPHIGHO2_12_38_15]OGT67372.1 MAG: dehydrogenase [Gammaproteobacteria bacterium RIFCSPLOWO2_02_FULL_38_11]